jgi:hypothetical protein
MANVRISDLPAGVALDGSELFESEQAAAGVQVTALQIWAGLSGAGDPEGVVTAPVGVRYWRIGVGEYVKDTGSGDTGWVQHTSIEE